LPAGATIRRPATALWRLASFITALVVLARLSRQVSTLIWLTARLLAAR
jgi:hypothetical protein